MKIEKIFFTTPSGFCGGAAFEEAVAAEGLDAAGEPPGSVVTAGDERVGTTPGVAELDAGPFFWEPNGRIFLIKLDRVEVTAFDTGCVPSTNTSSGVARGLLAVAITVLLPSGATIMPKGGEKD